MVNANESNLENGVGIPQSTIRNPHSNIPASILVVDDDEAARNLLEAILDRDDYTVCSAASGEEALAAVAQQLPDLILLDVAMPGIDGFEVARRLKADSRSRLIPIVLVTALADRTARLKGLEAGADEFLTKPVDRAELQARVRNLLKIKEYNDFLVDHNRILEEQVHERTAALQESEEKFRTATDTILDAFIIIEGEHGTITWWNAAAEAMFGYSKQEMAGRVLHDIIVPPRLHEAAQHGIAHFAQTGKGAAINQTLELAALRKNGEEFSIELSLSAMQVNGKWHAIGIVRDITARKQAEAQIAEQLSELRRWYDATLGQGMRNIELKREVNELLKQAGQPPRYLSAEPEEGRPPIV